MEDDPIDYLVFYLEGKEPKDRNRRIFEGKDLSLHDFKLDFLRILYSWSHALDGGANTTFVDFVDICKDFEGISFL